MKELKISEFADVVTGGTPSTSVKEYWENGNIPWLNSGELNKGYIYNAENFITEAGLKSSSTKMMPADTVLIALTGATCGLSAISKIEACANQSVTGILPSKNHVPEYLFYYLRTQRQRILDKAWGNAQPHISQAFIKEFKVPLPPLPDQLHIANLLSKAENLIAQRKESICLLDEYLKSTFLEMFGEPVINPKGWELKTLDKISNVGSSKRVFVEELVESGIPFFRGTEIGQLGEGKNITPTLYITKEHFEELKSHTGVPVIGDLLMPSICPDGRIFRVVNNESFYFKDGRVLWVKPNQNIVNSFYLHNTLKRLFITNYNKIASGTTFAELKIVALKKIQVPMPPIELQTQFAHIVEKTEAIKTQYQQSLQELENLYGSLNQKAFRGELLKK